MWRALWTHTYTHHIPEAAAAAAQKMCVCVHVCRYLLLSVYIPSVSMFLCVCMYMSVSRHTTVCQSVVHEDMCFVCVCVCVREREREREKEQDALCGPAMWQKNSPLTLSPLH